jgi:glycosyltransferase involved in cell wall biosynthesis
MLRDLDIVCFANDWSADPTSKHHLMRRLAATNRILWVEAAGMRAPSLRRPGDLHRLLGKARAMWRRPRQVLPTLYVYSPPVLPFPASRLARAINRLIYPAVVRRQLRRLGLSSAPVLWTFTPHVAPYLAGLERRLLIYHCVDRWSAFADYDGALMDRWEAELCARADVVFASAADLVERCRRWSERVHYIPHGVDHAHFARALDAGPLPDELRAIPEPRIGFFGLIHEWIDLPLLAALADRAPYSFVLIGEAKVDLGDLTARPNVFHLGRRSYDSLPDYCRGFHAAIVPFRTNELTRSVNPVKLREYAAAGLPVVSSDLPEVRRCVDVASCADGLDAWLAELERAVARGREPRERRAQSARVREQDWAAICSEISRIIRTLSAAGTPVR